MELLRGPRTFNRYELKYLVDAQQLAIFRSELDGRLGPDPHGERYGVWSCYYDTPDLTCYWEKIDGIRVRRKLRIRHYGDPFDTTDDASVFVEIKQRVNRVTQKRRLQCTYREARDLCDGGEGAADDPVADEVARLVAERPLRPISVVGYQREAFVGDVANNGVRVTFDRHLRGRDRDLHLGVGPKGPRLMHPKYAIIELKVNDRVPIWLSQAVARHNLTLIRFSKYCQSIEAHGLAPRSAFHLPEIARTAGDWP